MLVQPVAVRVTTIPGDEVVSVTTPRDTFELVGDACKVLACVVGVVGGQGGAVTPPAIVDGGEPSSNVRTGARSAISVRLAIDAVREGGVQTWSEELDRAG